ncbi:MAG: hypothetical protein JXP37_08570 [Coriobacteriia bacterium]|nr:hypothetical protein [Coriobacteriia bacterium]
MSDHSTYGSVNGGQTDPDEPVTEVSHDDDADDLVAPSWGRQVLGVMRSIAIGFGATILTLIVIAVLLYFLGGPAGPSREVRDAYAEMEEAGTVWEPAPEPQLVLPIPGCTCHSDDPVAIVHHAEYRLSDCVSCH